MEKGNSATVESSDAQDNTASSKNEQVQEPHAICLPEKRTKPCLSIPTVVVTNENNDIIEQMDEPSVDVSQAIRQNLKSKLMEKVKNPRSDSTESIQEELSENSESGSDEMISDSSDTERESNCEQSCQKLENEKKATACDANEKVENQNEENAKEQKSKEKSHTSSDVPLPDKSTAQQQKLESQSNQSEQKDSSTEGKKEEMTNELITSLNKFLNDSETDSSFNEKDFSQFNVTQPASTTTVLTPPPLMIPALGFTVNTGSLTSLEQFSQASIQQSTTSQQNFHQLNIQQTLSNPNVSSSQVIYTQSVSQMFPTGVNNMTLQQGGIVAQPQQNFIIPNQTINSLQIQNNSHPTGSFSNSPVQPINPQFFGIGPYANMPLGIVPLMQAQSVSPLLTNPVPESSTPQQISSFQQEEKNEKNNCEIPQKMADASTYANEEDPETKSVKLIYFRCDKCTFITKSSQNFRRHYMLHMDYKPFKCTCCSLTTCNKYSFGAHVRRHPECANAKYVFVKNPSVEKDLEKNVLRCRLFKWICEEEYDKTLKDLFGDQRKFRFKKNDLYLSPNAEDGFIEENKKNRQKKIRDILGEAKKLKEAAVLENVRKADTLHVYDFKDDSKSGEEEIPEKLEIQQPVKSKLAEDAIQLSTAVKHSLNNEKITSSKYLSRQLKKTKFGFRRKNKFRKRMIKVQNYEIVDKSNILDEQKRVRKFKTTFDPSPDLFKRKLNFVQQDIPNIYNSRIPNKNSCIRYKCTFCDYSGDTPVGVRRHAFWTHHMCEYSCRVCLYKSMSKKDCLIHNAKKHPGSSPCIKRSLINSMPVEEITLQNETETQTNDSQDQNSTSQLSVSDDETADSSFTDEKSSKEKVGTKVKHVSDGEEERQDDMSEKKIALVLNCKVCNMKFSYLGMQRHVFRKHNLWMYKCSLCAMTSQNQSQVMDHCIESHPELNPRAVRTLFDLNLDNEYVEFNKPGQMKKKFSHVLVPKRQKFSYQKKPALVLCPLCGYKSSNYNGVKRHLLMFHKLCRLQCGRCGYDMYSKDDTIKHSKEIHNEDEPYVIRSFVNIETVAKMSREKLKELGVKKITAYFDTTKSLLKHKNTTHKIQEKNSKVNESPFNENLHKVSEEAHAVVKCPLCASEKNSTRGVERHLFQVHKICHWLCKRCGFGSVDKYVTLQHSVDLHEDKDPEIARALVNLDKYLAERKMENESDLYTKDNKNSSTNQNADSESLGNFASHMSTEEEYVDENISPDKKIIQDESSSSRSSTPVTPGKRRSKSPKEYSKYQKSSLETPKKQLISQYFMKKKQMGIFSASSKATHSDSLESDSAEDGFGLKKKRKKTLVHMSNLSSAAGYSSFVVKPKDMNKLNSGFSCVYCIYAAPLRHQVRLHCYDKHTNHPACLMEFQMSGDEKFYRDDRVEDISDQSETTDNENVKSQILDADSSNVFGEEKDLIESESSDEKREKETNNDSEKRSEIGKVEVSDNDLKNEEDNNRKESIGSSETDTDELHASVIIDSGGKRFSRGRKRKLKFDNPLKTLVHRLNTGRINLEDTFQGSLDEVDSYLNQFGVRTLNMDMLTQQQFSNFIERFGNNLQPV